MSRSKTSLWKIQRLRAQQDTDEPGPRSGFFVPLPSSALAIAVLALIVAGAGVLLWQLWPHDPGNDSADAGFLRDMYEHHAQAVGMAMIIRDRTDDETLFFMATDIALTQSTQMGTMQGYLALWGLGLNGDDPPMAWMGSPVEAGRMRGMASDEEIEQLRTLPVAEAEVLFLQLMIRHHQGGVMMAEAALEHADQEHVVTMAERIVILQEAEIAAMNDMLVARGQEPITDPLPAHEGH